MRLSAWLLCSISLGTTNSMAADIHLSLTGMMDAQGFVQIGVFATAENFPYSAALHSQRIAVTETPITMSFSGLATGRYAIAAYHDSNNNQQLDTNFFGLPTERYGFSQNVRGLFGPPDFEAAAFELQKPHEKLTIDLE